jgi:nitrate/nitrite transporter NarK
VASIGVQIKKDLELNDTQFGLLVGTPILTGSLIRLMLGIWTDQYGGRIVYLPRRAPDWCHSSVGELAAGLGRRR